MGIILKQNVFIFRLRKLFEITYWNFTTFAVHAFLVGIIAFARSWEQEQTGEENKGDKHSIDSLTQRHFINE